jgi:parallel beta-helix repeat protein
VSGGGELTDLPDPRRRGLLALLACTPAWLSAFAVPQARARGAVVDVRSTGARGDGVRDDTGAIQRAIDALPAAGGIVSVPAGRYLVDPVRRIRLRSHMQLRLDPAAYLVAKPNAAGRAYVLLLENVDDVVIAGGNILGERWRHLGTRGEWGHGIAIQGSSRVRVRDIRISDCWGDGISLGQSKPPTPTTPRTPSQDVVLERVTCVGNRRQGLSIGHSRGVRVLDCTFADTHGTKPECGIDIEPDPCCEAHDVVVQRCRMTGNRGSGLTIYKRTFGVSVQGCTITGNHGHGILAVGTQGGQIRDNLISQNGYTGLFMRSGTKAYKVRGNRFERNAVRMPRVPGRRSNIELAKDVASIAIGGNTHLDE